LEISPAEERRLEEYLAQFIEENRIVYTTHNFRYYFDEEEKRFVLRPKYNVEGGGSNDLRNGIYPRKKVSQLGFTPEEMRELFEKFRQEVGGKISEQVPDKRGEVVVWISPPEAYRRFALYLLGKLKQKRERKRKKGGEKGKKGERLKLDSKIHPFEDGQPTFHDLLKLPKNYNISPWEAFFYWFGGRSQRWFLRGSNGVTYYIYPNSSNLYYLSLFKSYIVIPNRLDAPRREGERAKEAPTNIDFYHQLQQDSFSNPYFYISRSGEEALLKLLFFLFSYFFNYRAVAEKEKLYLAPEDPFGKALEILPHLSFVFYGDDGTFRVGVGEFKEGVRLFLFLKKLREIQKEGGKNLFARLAQIVAQLGEIDGEGYLAHRFATQFLKFEEVRQVYREASYRLLQREGRERGRGRYFRFRSLFQLEQLYLEERKEVKKMELHKTAKILGEGVGRVCGILDDKDLLFKLRNVKNFKQLVGFFKDFKYLLLKEGEKVGVSGEFNRELEVVLAEGEKNWEILRDNIAIYAIDKYRQVKFAREQGEG
jgi:hypothetical protein